MVAVAVNQHPAVNSLAPTVRGNESFKQITFYGFIDFRNEIFLPVACYNLLYERCSLGDPRPLDLLLSVELIAFYVVNLLKFCDYSILSDERRKNEFGNYY